MFSKYLPKYFAENVDGIESMKIFKGKMKRSIYYKEHWTGIIEGRWFLDLETNNSSGTRSYRTRSNRTRSKRTRSSKTRNLTSRFFPFSILCGFYVLVPEFEKTTYVKDIFHTVFIPITYNQTRLIQTLWKIFVITMKNCYFGAKSWIIFCEIKQSWIVFTSLNESKFLFPDTTAWQSFLFWRRVRIRICVGRSFLTPWWLKPCHISTSQTKAWSGFEFLHFF